MEITEEKIPMTKDWSQRSSQIARTWYDKEKQEMKVLFKSKNALWIYSTVPMELWKESLITPSIGKFLGARIKPDHAATKIS